MAALAVYMKTESGDSYLYCLHDQSIEFNLTEIRLSMDTELAYVNEFIVTGTNGMEKYCQEFEDRLIEIANGMEE